MDRTSPSSCAVAGSRSDARPEAVRRCRGDRGYVTDVRTPVALAVGVLIVVVTVLAIRVASGPTADENKPRALILGDSITDHGQRALNDELGPIYSLSIDGQDNFRIDDQLPVAERWATRPFRQVVVNLGTNDAVQGWPIDQSTANLTTLVSMFPAADCVHLTTVNEHLRARNDDVVTLATQLNAQIRAMAAVDPRIHVVDWNAIVETNLAQGVDLTSDGVHPTAEGNQLLVDAYDASMATCYRP